MERSTKTAVGITSAALASMAAAGAAYLYLGKNAPQRRQKLAAWMREAEKEIVEEAMKLKNAAFSEENYQRIIDVVTEKYRRAQQLDPQNIVDFISMMRENWEQAGRSVHKKSASFKTSRVRRKARKRATSGSR